MYPANEYFFVSTHSPMLLTFPDAEIDQIQKYGIVSLPFRETNHYRTTVRFLQNPESTIEDTDPMPVCEYCCS